MVTENWELTGSVRMYIVKTLTDPCDEPTTGLGLGWLSTGQLVAVGSACGKSEF
jgi:hypothetical protein